MSICKMDGCDGSIHGRGWCKSHYMRWYRHGDPEKIRYSPRGADFKDKLDRLVDRSGECWLWLGAVNPDGYGSVANGIDGQKVSAHRASYGEFVGEIPEGLQIDHLCSVRHCVNPDHLEAVTPAVNQQRARKRRLDGEET